MQLQWKMRNSRFVFVRQRFIRKCHPMKIESCRFHNWKHTIVMPWMLAIIALREMHDAEYYNHEPIANNNKKRCSVKKKCYAKHWWRCPTFSIFFFTRLHLRPREPRRKIFRSDGIVAKKKSEQKQCFFFFFELVGLCWTRIKKK